MNRPYSYRDWSKDEDYCFDSMTTKKQYETNLLLVSSYDFDIDVTVSFGSNNVMVSHKTKF